MCMQDIKSQKEVNEEMSKKTSPVMRMLTTIGAVFFISALVVTLNVQPAAADIAGDMSNFSLIIGNATSGFTGWTVNMIGIFMTPPLLYYVVYGFFIGIIALVAGLLVRRGRRR